MHNPKTIFDDAPRYYYGLVLLLRNGLVATLPIVTVELPELQAG